MKINEFVLTTDRANKFHGQTQCNNFENSNTSNEIYSVSLPPTRL